MSRVIEILVILLVAVFIALSLAGPHPGGSALRDYFVERGEEETGALNLVTAIYLGYRAYDTLGETVVLLLAVSGVMVFVEKKR